MGANGNIEDRREYSRVDAYIPCAYRIVLTEERPHVQARVSAKKAASEYPQISNLGKSGPVLEEWFQILNSKLDAIMHMLQLQQEGNFGLPYKAVNISGGGMSFSAPDVIPLGEVLEMKIILPFQDPVAIIAYGEVTKFHALGSGYLVALHFIKMDDSIRDLIVRFVFEREREIIRETRGSL